MPVPYSNGRARWKHVDVWAGSTTPLIYRIHFWTIWTRTYLHFADQMSFDQDLHRRASGEWNVTSRDDMLNRR